MSEVRKRKIPSGIFLTAEETHKAIQLFGLAHSHPGQETRDELNKHLQEMGKKYGHDWQKVEIAPNGEVILVEDVK